MSEPKTPREWLIKESFVGEESGTKYPAHVTSDLSYTNYEGGMIHVREVLKPSSTVEALNPGHPYFAALAYKCQVTELLRVIEVQRVALEKIKTVTGTSTLQWHIAHEATASARLDSLGVKSGL